MNEPHHTNIESKSNALGAGILYIVATPIGHLADITFRAVETLKQVGLIACEDTRVTRKLLNHYAIQTRCISYHEHNQVSAGEQLLEKLRAGEHIALVSDAGTPLIADPGASLIRAAAATGIRIVPVPGACAMVAALSAAGIGAGDAYFAGFLPASGKDRASALRKLSAMNTTLVLYEAPHRITKTLIELQQTLGNREAVLARELTKMFETLYRGTLESLQTLSETSALKGEMVLLIAPAKMQETSDDLVMHMLREALARLPVSKAAAEVAAATGKPKRELYDLALTLQHEAP